MKYSAAWLFTLLVVLALAAASSAVAAEVYKWVDKDGKVHYSERKPPQAGEKVVDIRIPSSPHPTLRPPATATSRSQEASAPAESVKRKEDSGHGFSSSRPKSLSGGKIDETRESKCNLARDVLSGAVKHGNGAPTDPHDRQVAENDIRLFCR
jgi:opacity protein-like surface antigen